MLVEITFEKINKGPRNLDPAIRASLNDCDFYQGSVSTLCMELESQDSNTLRIYFANKTNQDTATDSNGNIVSDMNFTLSGVRVDGIDFGHLLWNGKYISEDQTFPGCLFFGPQGYYEITFDYPVLKWQLQQRNEPGWEQDYHYYETACKILNKLPGH
jgi:hypothetical protein